jgi:general secretion pathway protein A
MYLSFFKLKSKPFQTATDNDFSWFGKNHADALVTLEDKIHNDNGFFLLFGESGIGKTTLINCLIKTFETNFITIKVPNSDIGCSDFFKFLAESFQINNKLSSKGAFFVHFNFYLKNAYSADKRLIIIVDDAHKLKNDVLKELSILSDIEINNAKMINILLVGQNNLNELIEEQDTLWVKNKITYRYSLKPLTEQETDEYIKQHLMSAGLKRKLFTSEAVQEIYSFSKGNPILINTICNSAMLTAYSNDVKKINAEIIKECSDEFQISKSVNCKKDEQEKIFKKKFRKPIFQWNKMLVWKSPIVTVIILIIVFIAGYLFSQLESETTAAYPSREKETHKEHNELLHSLDKVSDDQAIKLENTGGKPANVTRRNGIQVNNLNTLNFLDQKYVIHYKNNSKSLSKEAVVILDKIIGIISQYPDSEIIIKGYTDSIGNYWHNMRLSKLRANFVKSYLVGKGVPELKIIVYGLGSKDPMESNKTANGRMKNRRVEIMVNIKDQV